MSTRITYVLIDAAEIASRFSALLGFFTDDLLNAYLEAAYDPDGIRVADDMPRATAAALPERWPQGRLFTRQADLRWERTKDRGLHAVLIADGELPASVREPLDLTPIGKPNHQQRVLLWGEHRNNAWREERIPRLNGDQLVYPKNWTGPYAAIITCSYEAPLLAQRPEFAGVRTVVRYLDYDGNFDPDTLTVEPAED